MGILYQLRDYLKIIGRGHIKNHITYSSLAALSGQEPFVSIHIPSYNEEPEMLIHTIQCVTKLDYTNYELIIIKITVMKKYGNRSKNSYKNSVTRVSGFIILMSSMVTNLEHSIKPSNSRTLVQKLLDSSMLIIV